MEDKIKQLENKIISMENDIKTLAYFMYLQSCDSEKRKIDLKEFYKNNINLKFPDECENEWQDNLNDIILRY